MILFLSSSSFRQAPNRTDDQKCLLVDGANGIGALKLREMEPYLQGALKVSLFCDGTGGKLNHQCGADFVKVQQNSPKGINASMFLKVDILYQLV